MISVVCFSFAIILFLVPILIKLYLWVKRLIWKRKNGGLISIGFFHPYCNAGGGGERVLWTAICAAQKEYKNAHCVVYSGDPVPPENILKNVHLRFNISILRRIDIIYLRRRSFVEAKYYPFFTLLLQSLGSIILGLEALLKHTPDVYIDTMGYAWTLPVFKLLGSCRVGAYVHFPTISTEMLKVVETRTVAFNNQPFISNSLLFSHLKLAYYKIFAVLYGIVGRQAEVIMVNSSWTRGHILDLWKKPERTFTVYPPCDVSEFNNIPLEMHNYKTRFLSIAQFRPEKNHELQIRAFYNFVSQLGRVKSPPVLVLIGSCRHEGDYDRVRKLKNLCSELGISQTVEFRVNLTFQELISEMKNASLALHSMKDEHFGIGIVECMSAGLIMIAHDSGGPKMDIVVDYNGKKTGFLASEVDSFAEMMKIVWEMNPTEQQVIRKNARDSVSRFSIEKFEETFLQAIKLFFI